jgi:hypothetical protein
LAKLILQFAPQADPVKRAILLKLLATRVPTRGQFGMRCTARANHASERLSLERHSPRAQASSSWLATRQSLPFGIHFVLEKRAAGQ